MQEEQGRAWSHLDLRVRHGKQLTLVLLGGGAGSAVAVAGGISVVVGGGGGCESEGEAGNELELETAVELRSTSPANESSMVAH